LKPDLEMILQNIPIQVWNEVAKTGSDMKWRSWWNLRWYSDDGKEIDGMRPQFIRGVDHEERPYERSVFGPSKGGRFGSKTREVAYFGVNHATATCETMKIFRENDNLTSEEVLKYLNGDLPSGETSKGYTGDYKLDCSARVVDIRNNNNALFRHIVGLGEWKSCDEFGSNLVYSKDESAIPDTQLISQEVASAGFDGIWYRSVRTPANLLVGSGECLILFEGREKMLRHFGD